MVVSSGSPVLSGHQTQQVSQMAWRTRHDQVWFCCAFAYSSSFQNVVFRTLKEFSEDFRTTTGSEVSRQALLHTTREKRHFLQQKKQRHPDSVLPVSPLQTSDCSQSCSMKHASKPAARPQRNTSEESPFYNRRLVLGTGFCVETR